MGCLAAKYPRMYPDDASENLQMEYQRRVLHLIADAKLSDAAPVIVRGINDIHEPEAPLHGELDAGKSPVRTFIFHIL